MAAFDASVRIGEGGKETLNYLGSACAGSGQLEALEKHYAQVPLFRPFIFRPCMSLKTHLRDAKERPGYMLIRRRRV